MTALQCAICATDDEFAQASLFLLQHFRDVHPSYSTLETATLIYMYITEGHLVLARDGENAVGACAYYHGTRDNGYEDKEVVLIDVALSDRTYRGSRLFLQGLSFMIGAIAKRHPEAKEIRLVAQSDNRYLNRLYSKFVEPSGVRDGRWGEETIYAGRIDKIRSVVDKWNRV